SIAETENGYRLWILLDDAEEPDFTTIDIITKWNEYRLEGNCWMPLYKNLTCEYEGTIYSSITGLEGSFKGHVDNIKIYGLSSPYHARREAETMALNQANEHVAVILNTALSRDSHANSACTF
ncbi:MAG: hypothetical protein SVY53_11110, partial [Chloroflexota bacterium]|nr:hypothetical protein [Chloroflexota bacterium]